MLIQPGLDFTLILTHQVTVRTINLIYSIVIRYRVYLMYVLFFTGHNIFPYIFTDKDMIDHCSYTHNLTMQL